MGAVRIEPGAVVRLVLDRPPLNVADIALLEELAAAVPQASSLPGAKVVVLTGAGRAFCAGVDVRDHTRDRVAPMITAFASAIRALLDCPLPVIAAVNGTALGGGLELALACDVLLVRSDSRLGQPETRIGVFPPAAAALLPRRVLPQHAIDLVLTGRTITGADAERIGLALRAFDAEDFEQEVDAYAAQLCHCSGPVLRLAKRAVRAGFERPLHDALAAADELYLGELMSLRDAHEGLAAFMEKRKPVWSEA